MKTRYFVPLAAIVAASSYAVGDEPISLFRGVQGDPGVAGPQGQRAPTGAQTADNATFTSAADTTINTGNAAGTALSVGGSFDLRAASPLKLPITVRATRATGTSVQSLFAQCAAGEIAIHGSCSVGTGWTRGECLSATGSTCIGYTGSGIAWTAGAYTTPATYYFCVLPSAINADAYEFSVSVTCLRASQ